MNGIGDGAWRGQKVPPTAPGLGKGSWRCRLKSEKSRCCEGGGRLQCCGKAVSSSFLLIFGFFDSSVDILSSLYATSHDRSQIQPACSLVTFPLSRLPQRPSPTRGSTGPPPQSRRIRASHIPRRTVPRSPWRRSSPRPVSILFVSAFGSTLPMAITTSSITSRLQRGQMLPGWASTWTCTSAIPGRTPATRRSPRDGPQTWMT